MPSTVITCPHCGFSKDVPTDRLPHHDVRVTCPHCRQGFAFSREQQLPREQSDGAPLTATAAANLPHVLPETEPDRHSPLAELPVEQGGEKAKKLLLLFVLLIVVLVGVRLWADAKKRNVPFPNFIAVSAHQVAVTWGQEIYFLDHSGKVLRKQSLPPEIIPTQLKYVGDELWIADYAGKTIKRVKNNALETVVNAAGRFRGTFKFAVDLQTGQIFVTDASNHKVHLYATNGSYIDSFGFEGKEDGGLKFPNTIVFDQKGRLLIVNTNAHRIDIYERDGEFIEPFATVVAMGNYRFPTLLAQTGDRVAFLHTIDLREAKAVMYGSDGRYVGELVPPKPLLESGDIAALDGTVLVSDNRERKVYRFSGDNLSYLGPFSAELDTLGIEATRRESSFAMLANGALYALLACCVPVFVLYGRMRRKELKAINATDYRTVIPPDALWTSEPERSKLVSGALLLVLALLCLLGSVAMGAKNPLVTLLLLIGQLVLFIVGWVRFAIQSGYTDPSRKAILERLVKSLFGKISGILGKGESVCACTAVRLNLSSNQVAMLLLTNRRLVVIDMSVRSSGISQIGYGNIASLTLEPANPSSLLFRRLLKNCYFNLQLKLGNNGGIQFSGANRQLLERLRQHLEEHHTDGENLDDTIICDTCLHPKNAGGCPNCTATNKDNWKPLIISLLYPGLGQFYNRELVRGTLVSSFFSFGIISLTIPIIKITSRSAEFTSQHVNVIAQNIAGLLFLYAVSCLDADQLGRKGRKLFSVATGDALRDWLTKKVSLIKTSRKNILFELVPGITQILAGRYRRILLLCIPLALLLWEVAWSLTLIVTGYSSYYDFVLLTVFSAIAALLWIFIVIDGLHQLDRQPVSPRLTAKDILVLVGVPCITLLAGFLAQLLREKGVEADPALREAIQKGYNSLTSLTGSKVRGLSGTRGASMFFGWGAAVMVIMATTAWLDDKGVVGIGKDALSGFIGGVVCWIASCIVTCAIRGSAYILPMVLGVAIGLLVYLYFRKNGASSLIVPAVFAGSVIGNQVVTFSNSALLSLMPFLGGGATRIFMVAVPAFFMHGAFLFVTKILPQIAGENRVSKEG